MSELEGNFNGESRVDLDQNRGGDIRDPGLSKIYRDLFQDDYDGREIPDPQIENDAAFHSREVMDALFADDFDLQDNPTDQTEDIPYEANDKFDADSEICETDDNGSIYKVNGELRPNTEYTIGGVTYKTDELGRIILCEGSVKQTPDGERDLEAQKQVGGQDRREGDQGAHIVARILGGAKGIENLLPVRETINKGPYKTMENEISQALDEGKDVSIHVDVKYDGDSRRPSEIAVTHIVDGKETVTEYDNDEGSTDLLDSIEDKVDREQYQDLKQEISDANADGGHMSVIAVKTEYDSSKEVSKVTVVTRDESTGGPNEKRVLLPKEDA